MVRGENTAEFLDRSLGRHVVAEALRAEGLVVQTLAERYPETEEFVEDETWIREVTADRLVILMKDDRIRRKLCEQQAILESGSRAFVVTNASLTGEQLAELFVENRNRIIQRSRHPGPYIYGVDPGRLEKLFPEGVNAAGFMPTADSLRLFDTCPQFPEPIKSQLAVAPSLAGAVVNRPRDLRQVRVPSGALATPLA